MAGHNKLLLLDLFLLVLGADDPQANSFLDQRSCLSLVKSVLLTADGPPLGSGQSAGNFQI